MSRINNQQSGQYGVTQNMSHTNSHVMTAESVSKHFYVYTNPEGTPVLTEKRRWFSRKKPSELAVLKDLSIDIAPGELLAFLGPSGCGKTTLLRIFAGFEFPSSGMVRFKDESIEGPDPQRAMVFQSERAVYPWLTVEGNIGLGPRLQGMERGEMKKQVAETIELLQLNGFERAYPKTLSGGMLQRVAVGRAIVNHPEVLLMDEPFGALDAQTRNNLQDHVIRIWKSVEQTIVFVTHDIEEAAYLSNRVVVFTCRPGQIKEIVKIDLPHMRDRTSREFIEYRSYLTDLIIECKEDVV